MHIDNAGLDRLARLARLGLDDGERERLMAGIESVLDMVSALRNVDVNAVLPMAHPHDAQLRLRADAVDDCNRLDALEQIAPQMQSGLYLVPKVIE